MTSADLWVVGRSGLLGSAVVRAASGAFAARTVPWTDPDAAARVLADDLDRFLAGASAEWAIVWAAGAAVIGSPASAVDRETAVLDAFLTAVAERVDAGATGGVFFFASSASVYAGSEGAPFDERSEPRPLNLYGRSKLRHEALVTARLGTLIPVVLGRISTLYGPGQNLAKQQGLVSRMAKQAASRRPISIFVPLDTLRDYLYVDDAARMVLALLHAARRDGNPGSRVRNVVDGHAVTVGRIASLVKLVSRRRIGIWQAGTSIADGHVHDLRLATINGHEVDAVQRTPLATGVARVYADVLGSVIGGGAPD